MVYLVTGLILFLWIAGSLVYNLIYKAAVGTFKHPESMREVAFEVLIWPYALYKDIVSRRI
jgi:hypothetical protein